MATTLITTHTNARPSRVLIKLLRFAGPAVLSAFVAWGAVQFAKGCDATRLDNLEQQSKDTLTRQEFSRWTEEQRDRHREIKEDIRAIQREK